MQFDPQQLVEALLAIAMFTLVMSLWIGGILLWARRHVARQGEVRQRLGLQGRIEDRDRVIKLWLDGREVETTVHTKRRATTLPGRIERHFQQAGLQLPFLHILALVLGSAFLSAIFVSFVTGKVLLGLGVVAVLLAAGRIYMLSRINRRQAQFDTQLVDALELAARSLRAGHPLLGAFQLLADEMGEPVSHIFADVCAQHGLGADLETVLRAAGDKSGSGDMKIFATSVAMQVRTGGNLADLMERLAEVMRDRMRLHRRVRVLTAQTQISKRVLIALPFVIFIVFNIINPKYMSIFYYERVGTYMLAAGIVMLAMGSWVMNKMATLKY